MADDTTAERPMLRIVRGDATPEDVAAIVALLAAAGGSTERKPEGMGLWRHQGRLRAMPYPGPNSWRASGLPT